MKKLTSAKLKVGGKYYRFYGKRYLKKMIFHVVIVDGHIYVIKWWSNKIWNYSVIYEGQIKEHIEKGLMFK